MKTAFFLWVIFFGFFNSPRTWAWSQHHLITRAALSQVQGISEMQVTATELLPLLKKMEFPSLRSFNEAIQIHKYYVFDFKLNEEPGDKVSALDILSHYSDEPDWGMDRELFEPDQYPDLWKKEFSMMGGKKGKTSQAFRHMYFPEFNLLYPLATFKLPKLFSSMGEAPVRAAILLDFARKARVAGDLYWALRFTANALHFLEDLAQPFHTSQVPAKVFMVMPLFGPKDEEGSLGYVKEVTNIVAYYHFAYEEFLGRLMMEGNSDFQGFLKNGNKSRSVGPLTYEKGDISGLCQAMAKLSALESSSAARASLGFFPKITGSYSKLNPGDRVSQPEWWDEVAQRSQTEVTEKARYFSTVKSVFEPLGDAIRAVVHAEVL